MRLVIADAQPAFRSGVRHMLQGVCDLEVKLVIEAGDGEEAVRAAVEHRPDVVVTELWMPVMDGLEATRQILARAAGTQVLVLTTSDDERSVTAALRAGARGYVLKSAGRDELGRAVRAVAAGESIFSPAIATCIIGRFAGIATGPQDAVFPELTRREREVLALVAQGLSNSEITRRLVLSPKTVRNHVSSCLTKLRVSSRSAAIVRAREAGLGCQSG